jgi:hypothetical protein
MTSTEILLDSYSRIRDEVADVLRGVGEATLEWRPDPQSNNIAWLIWHLTRVQDDHLAAGFDRPQVWQQEGWMERFGLPFEPYETGYGQTAEQVGQLHASADLLAGYHEAVADRTDELLRMVTDAELARIVDERWDPPVTLAVRLVSVVADALQHIGQAAYVKGLAERGGAV